MIGKYLHDHVNTKYVRVNELKVGDYFVQMGLIYRVIKSDNPRQMRYRQVEFMKGRANGNRMYKGINSQETIEKILIFPDPTDPEFEKKVQAVRRLL